MHKFSRLTREMLTLEVAWLTSLGYRWVIHPVRPKPLSHTAIATVEATAVKDLPWYVAASKFLWTPVELNPITFLRSLVWQQHRQLAGGILSKPMSLRFNFSVCCNA